MANPPRPWFRLASIRAVPVPAPAPAPQPQPTQPPPPPPQEAPPRFASDARTSAPSSPSHKVPPPAAASSSSVQASPLQKATITNSSSPAYHRDSSTSSSPRSPKTIKQAVQSPKQSPKLKPSVPPPSPLTLPPSSSSLKTEPNMPAEAEAEPKTVLVEMTVDKPRQWPNGSGDYHRERETGESRNSSNHASSRHGKLVAGNGKESEGKEKGSHKKLSDSEDSGMRVITIAGENRGAYMELIQSQKKHEPKHVHKINGIAKEKSDGGESESSSSSGNKKERSNRGRSSSSSSSFPMAAYMNSNVQCVNNSLLFHASCSHHDPGVRLSLSKKPFAEGAYHLKEAHNV